MTKPLKSRIEFLRELLSEQNLSTQEDLVEKLERAKYSVTQSTVSRDLRKLGAVKAIDHGRTVYRLPEELFIPVQTSSLKEMVTSLRTNGSLIVIRTHPGSASLVGRFVDMTFADDILGCIAGDDTVFVAPENHHQCASLMKRIDGALRER